MRKKTLNACLGLMLLALLPMACQVNNEAGQTRLAVDADTSLFGFDPVLILLRDGNGTDTLFNGKLLDLDTLKRLPVQSYTGGKAQIIIQGYRAGQLFYEERRDYDGGTGRVATTVTLDLSRTTNSFGALDVRPDVIKLYRGGSASQMELGSPDLWQGKNLVWSTGDPGVATVSQSGLLTPIGVGITYVRAVSGDTAGDASAVTVVRDIPTLGFGAADTAVGPGASASFEVEVTQEYGDVKAFAWDLDGDGIYEDSLAGTAGQTLFESPSRTYGAAGEISVHVRVRDAEGNVAIASKRVSVGGGIPDIDSLTALPDLVNIGDSVAFSASASGRGAALLSYAWDFDGDGKDEVTGILQGPSAPIRAGYRYPKAGSFLAALRVSDALGASATAKLPVQVKLDRPTADAGPDQSVPAGATVLLKGKAADSLGAIVKREWKIASAEYVPVSDSGTASFTAPTVPGDVVCVFRATDDDGFAAEDTLKVTINDSKGPTVTPLLPKDTVVTVKDSVAFASGASASDADLKSYSLDVDGDGVEDLQGPLNGRTGAIHGGYRYAKAGSFNVTLKVTDVAGKSATSQSRVVVKLDAPKADAGPDTVVAAGTRVNLHGKATDSLGTIASLEWKIGAGAFVPVSKGDTAFTAATAAGAIDCVFRVTDDDGNTASDTVSITVSPSTLAELSGLAVSAGTLAPAFAAKDTVYTASVANSVRTIQVRPAAAGAMSSVKVNGTVVASGAASDTLPLAVGNTVITVVVTAQDGATRKTYKVTVTRAADANADLSSLVTSAGAFSPAFAAATIAYSANVPYTTGSITVTPTAAGPAGTAIKVNAVAVASGTPSGPITLVSGANAISIVVTAANGTTAKTYTLNVTRSNSAKLSTLTLPVGMTFNQAFHPDTLAYYVTATATAAACKFTPTAADAAGGATIAVDGTPLVSGTQSPALAYPYGTVAHTIVVTAPDGVTTRAYTLNVWRKDAPAATLTGYALISDVATTRTLSDAATGGSDQFHNPGGDVQFETKGAGNYTVTFLGLATLANAEGIVHVTSSGTEAGYCKATDWTSNGSVSARIACYDQYGFLIDRPISVVVLFPRGSGSGHNAFVWADKPAASGAYVPYAGRSWSDVSGFDGNTVQHVSAGTYTVTFKGQGSATDPGSVMVTATGTGTTHCGVASQAVSGSNLNATVTCRTPLGALADGAFNASLMRMYSNTDFGVAMGQVVGTTLGYSSNSSGGAVSISKLGDGMFYVSLNGIAGIGPGRNGGLLATPFGAQGGACLAGAWSDWGGGLYIAAINCYDETWTPANVGFNFLFLK